MLKNVVFENGKLVETLVPNVSEMELLLFMFKNSVISFFKDGNGIKSESKDKSDTFSFEQLCDLLSTHLIQKEKKPSDISYREYKLTSKGTLMVEGYLEETLGINEILNFFRSNQNSEFSIQAKEEMKNYCEERKKELHVLFMNSEQALEFENIVYKETMDMIDSIFELSIPIENVEQKFHNSSEIFRDNLIYLLRQKIVNYYRNHSKLDANFK